MSSSRVVDVLEALVADERRLVLVAGERQRRLAPEPAHEAGVDALLGEAVVVVPDLVLVVVALDQDRDLLARQVHVSLSMESPSLHGNRSLLSAPGRGLGG